MVRLGRLVMMGITGTYILYNITDHLWVARVSAVSRRVTPILSFVIL